MKNELIAAMKANLIAAGATISHEDDEMVSGYILCDEDGADAALETVTMVEGLEFFNDFMPANTTGADVAEAHVVINASINGH